MVDVAKIAKKMIDEAVAAQMADVGVFKAKRGQKFKITDAKPYVDAVKNMKAVEGQCKEVIDLHVESVKAHYEILKDLTDTIAPKDDPFVEHYQTPPILEILYEDDPDFRAAAEKFMAQLEADEALIARESMRRYGGMYGPTCVVDFAFSPGSVSNVVNEVLKNTDIDGDYKKTLLASKSWGMNTSYGIGAAFTEAVEAGKTAAEAARLEVEQMQKVYDTPVQAQIDLMDDADMTSFDQAEYMKRYKERMKPFVLAAKEAGVHPANIVVVPAYCVGDVGHHIAESTFNMLKDDVNMEIVEVVSNIMKNTLERGLEAGYDSLYDVLSVATGSTAAAVSAMLWDEGFTSPMIIDLLTKRFHNYVNLNPARGQAAELHNVDFMDMIHRGDKIIDDEPIGAGCKVKGVEVDFSPWSESEILNNLHRYAYPACSITVKFSSFMRMADFPCLLTSEPVTATLMTNIIATDPGQVVAPARYCKDCAVCLYVKKHKHCNWKDTV
ncbi:DUF2193 domain-containing protein [Halanaerobium sp. Z-7514]|uniref:DUF2193 domain-containing protein n=1 Tax=Halanaerobium polyolivorans TaxID=2886943 RepID=A0AAW4WYP2_9FIRM|nr:DUF2193 domain-containing protein [Halanaerobium polyolivorans]MCC3144097.1 DUF2193 domain-containing protein [Halanaerobium polyolivorans]RQD73482.1 MAG: DUF2193 domain-containing protein [Halanaerobium sp. MSAO_Bac5]